MSDIVYLPRQKILTVLTYSLTHLLIDSAQKHILVSVAFYNE